SLAHKYNAAGMFSVSVSVSDDDVTSTASTSIVVLTQADGVRNILALVGDVRSLGAKLEAAIASLDRGNNTSASNQLDAFNNEVAAMAKSGRMTTARAAELQGAANRVLRSIRTIVAM